MDTKKLKKLREERGITIKQMQILSGLHRHTITKIERGDENSSIRSLKAYLAAFTNLELSLTIKM